MKKILRNITAVLLVLSLALGVYAAAVIGEISTEVPTEVPSVKFYEAFTKPDDSSASVMNTGTDDAESYDVYALLEFDYPDLDLSTLEGLDVEARRDAVRDYYKPRNEQIVAQLGLEGVTVSYSAPFADVAFDSIAEYQNERDELITASNDSTVEFIGVGLLDLESGETTEDGTTTENDENCTMTEVKSVVGIPTDNTYSGSNIKVGLIESGLPDKNHDIFGDVSPFTFYSETEDAKEKSHATKVAAIIDSIAPNVTYYSAAPGADASQITQALNWLLTEQKVNIINLSAVLLLLEGDETPESAEENNNAGPMYTQLTAYVDYLIATNGCLIVKSAGNRPEDREITAPGMGINVLTVGSVNINGELSFYSSYTEDEEEAAILKPEVVAPGEKIVFKDPDKTLNYFDGEKVKGVDKSGQLQNGSGTSYSAPVVTGMAVLLMEEFTKLKTDPALLKNVIMVGCQRLASTSDITYDFLDDRAGVGLVNYTRSRTVMQNNQYGTYVKYSENEEVDTKVFEGTFSIASGDVAKFTFSRMILGDNSEFANDEADYEMTNYRVVITVSLPGATYTGKEFIWDASIAEMRYANSYGATMNCRIQIFVANSDINPIEEITVAYTGATHQHLYTASKNVIDNRYHRCYCTCNSYSVEAHSYPEDTGTQRYCTECGYPEGLLH